MKPSLLSRQAIAILLAACNSEPAPDEPGADAGGDGEAVTYYRDVKPVLERNCLACHVDGGLAPFALDTPDAAVAAAGAIALVTEDRRMPPWPPGDATPPLRHSRRLSDTDIATLGDWAEAGAPLGDPATAAAPQTPEVIDIGAIDLAFDIGVDYVPDTSVTDEYRCFVTDLAMAQSQLATGFRVIPGNARTVHHVILTLFAGDDLATLRDLDAQDERPGWSCLAGPVPLGTPAQPIGGLGSWVPGVSAVALPAGTATAVPASSVVVTQVHYNTAGGTDPDRTRVEVAFADPEASASLVQLGAIRLGTVQISIPAGASAATAGQSLTVAQWRALRGNAPFADGDGYLLGTSLHAHLLATQMTTSLTRDAETSVLLDIPRWDFHWQGGYTYTTPIQVFNDDLLSIQCVYDNSDAHRASVGLGPSVPVTFGEGTADEMCLGGFTVVDELP